MTKNSSLKAQRFCHWNICVLVIALRLPVVRIGLYNRPLWVVSLSNHFGFRASDFEFLTEKAGPQVTVARFKRSEGGCLERICYACRCS